jgi:hypothetical protein
MLGGNCSSCCGCNSQKAAAINAQLKTMRAEIEIDQRGYIPQSGLLAAINVGQVAAADWASVPPDPPASLADARGRLPTAPFNPFCRLYEKEEQVSDQPYVLLLDASEESPSFVYEDDHIKIEVSISFTPFNTGMVIDDSGCGFIWGVRVSKRRREAQVQLNDVMTIQPIEKTYGPQTQGGISAAAVAKIWPFEYGTATSFPRNLYYPFNGPVRLPETYYNEVSYTAQFSSIYQPQIYYNFYADYGTGSATFDPSGSGLQLTLDDDTNTNDAFAMFDRTSSNYDLQPKLIRNPSYLLERTSDSQVVFSQDQTTISPKVVGFNSSPFTVSAVVRLTP